MNMFCVTIYNDHYDKIKNLGYIPVGLGENVSSNEFITDKLDLSSDEAEKFWPIYNAFEKACMELRHEKLKDLKDNLKKEINVISEAEALSKLNEMIAIEDELVQLKRSFRTKLEGIISNKKIILLKIAEDGFNRRMIDRLKHRSK